MRPFDEFYDYPSIESPHTYSAAGFFVTNRWRLPVLSSSSVCSLIVGPNSNQAISVIIAAHNAQSTLEEAIRSLQEQSLPVQEILIGDDASTDGTSDLLKQLAHNEPRLRIITSEVSLGPGSMRQRLIENAKGDWIALLDADDTWRSNRIELLAPWLSSADVLSDDLIYWIDGKQEAGTLCQSRAFNPTIPTFLDASTLIRMDLGWLKPLIRKEFLSVHNLSYREGLRHSEDFDLYLRLLLAKARWIHHPSSGYLYRRHAISLSKNWREGLSQSRSAYLRLAQECPKESSLNSLLHHRIKEKDAIAAVYEARDLWNRGPFSTRLRVLWNWPLIRSLGFLICTRIRRRWSR